MADCLEERSRDPLMVAARGALTYLVAMIRLSRSLLTISSLMLVGGLALSGCKGSASFKAGSEPETPAAPAPKKEAPAPAPKEDPPDVHIEGDHITIDQKIHFETDSDVIMDDSSEILDHIAQALNNHPELTVLHVVGHTDDKGGHDHNQELSEKRAASVVAALQERGVEQQLDSKGVGETEPACEEDTDECHEQNRRVEFIVEKAAE